MTPVSKSTEVLDLDALSQWGPWIAQIVVGIASQTLVDELSETSPEFIEDACDWVFDRIGRGRVLRAIEEGMANKSVRLYHGTRLAAAELLSVQRQGLKPLCLDYRRSTLVDALSAHPRWPEVEKRIDDALEVFGPLARAGRREDGCVHVCFSRAGLLYGCNHYLTHGAEVDGHIAHYLFGDNSGHNYLRDHRRPYLIWFDVSFDVAAQGSSASGDLAAGRELLAEKLLGYWAYGTAHPTFRVDTQRDCAAAKVVGVVSPDLLEFERVEEGRNEGNE